MAEKERRYEEEDDQDEVRSSGGCSSVEAEFD